MTAGDAEAKRAHLNEILGNFLQDRIEQLFGDDGLEDGSYETLESMSQGAEQTESTELGRIDPYGNEQGAPISPEELESFRNVDLRLLDNPEYFKAIFDRT